MRCHRWRYRCSVVVGIVLSCSRRHRRHVTFQSGCLFVDEYPALRPCATLLTVDDPFPGDSNSSACRCKPKKCRQECKKSCPVVKIGKMCVEVSPTSKLAWISEELCIGCVPLHWIVLVCSGAWVPVFSTAIVLCSLRSLRSLCSLALPDVRFQMRYLREKVSV